jgi:hypothetical protein
VEKKSDYGTPGPESTISENNSQQVVLRREQHEQLEVNHRENGVTRSEAGAESKCHTHSPQENEEMAVWLEGAM